MKDYVRVTLAVDPDSPRALRLAGYDRTVAGAVKGAPDVLIIQPGQTLLLLLDPEHDATLRVGNGE